MKRATEIVSIRLTPAQAAVVNAMAEKEGKPRSEYLRDQVAKLVKRVERQAQQSATEGGGHATAQPA